MKIVPKKFIEAWYKEEYSSSAGSVYGQPVEILMKFFDLLKEGGNVLEIGCGDGRNLFPLAARGHTVTGVDLFGKEVVESRAKQVGVHVEFIETDVTEFHFQKEHYHAIISSEVFHLMERKDVEGTIEHMKHAVERGGYIYISILSNLKRHFLKTKEEFKYAGQPDYASEEVKKFFQHTFSNWKICTLDSFHDEQDWPVKKGNHPIDPYHWSGDYVYIIAQKL